MEHMETLWNEAKYHELDENCLIALQENPDDITARCTHACCLAAMSTIILPKIQEARKEFLKGYALLSADAGAEQKAGLLQQFCQALEITQANIEKESQYACLFETSVIDYRSCQLALLDTVFALIDVYTPEMKTAAACAESFAAICIVGLNAAERYTKTRGVKRMTDKKTFVTVSFVTDVERANAIAKYEQLLEQIHAVQPDYVPACEPERELPDEDGRADIINAFYDHLDSDIVHNQGKEKTKKEKKGGFFARLFGKQK